MKASGSNGGRLKSDYFMTLRGYSNCTLGDSPGMRTRGGRPWWFDGPAAMVAVVVEWPASGGDRGGDGG